MIDLFAHDIIIEDERARLTPLKTDDIDVLEPVSFHPQMWELGMSKITNREELENYITVALEEKAKHQSYPFLIFDKKLNRVAGSTRYGSISLVNKRVEIGWTWIHPDFQRTGLNRHCKFLLLEFGFEELGLNRIELKTDLLNEQSKIAIRSLGAKEEGIFRKHQITSTGRIRDSIFFSIIDEEWPQIKKNLLIKK